MGLISITTFIFSLIIFLGILISEAIFYRKAYKDNVYMSNLLDCYIEKYGIHNFEVTFHNDGTKTIIEKDNKNEE